MEIWTQHFHHLWHLSAHCSSANSPALTQLVAQWKSGHGLFSLYNSPRPCNHFFATMPKSWSNWIKLGFRGKCIGVDLKGSLKLVCYGVGYSVEASHDKFWEFAHEHMEHLVERTDYTCLARAW